MSWPVSGLNVVFTIGDALRQPMLRYEVLMQTRHICFHYIFTYVVENRTWASRVALEDEETVRFEGASAFFNKLIRGIRINTSTETTLVSLSSRSKSGSINRFKSWPSLGH